LTRLYIFAKILYHNNDTDTKEEYMQSQRQRLNKKKQNITSKLPPLTEILRGTFIEWWQVCARSNCKCHKSRKYQHGPFYRVSYSKGNRSYHVYVPLKDKEKIKTWVNNYNKLWQGIEDISALNIKLIRKTV